MSRAERLVDRSRTAVCATLLFAACFRSVGSPGDMHFSLSMEHLAGGRTGDALETLAVAIELDPTHSDAYFLRAKILGIQDVRGAIYHLERALDANHFATGDRDAALVSLAELYLRTRNISGARALLLATPAADRAHFYYLLAETYRRGGELLAAVDVARYAMGRFPTSTDSYLVYHQILMDLGEPIQARRVLEIGAQTAAEPTSVVSRLLVDSWQSPEFPDRLQRYVEQGGSDPTVYAAALRRAPNPVYLAGFLESGGHRDLLLLRNVMNVVREHAELQKSLQSRLVSYSGIRAFDSNADGFPDQWYSYQDGVLLQWSSDSDQDGVSEVVWDATTSSLTLAFPAYTSTWYYRSYPYLDRVVYGSHESEVTYRLAPLRTVGPLLEGISDSALSGTIIQFPAVIPGESSIRDASTAVEVKDHEDGNRLWAMGPLGPTRMWGDEDGDGRPEHVIRYQDGRAVSGERDLDGDGLMDVRERWSGGALIEILVDIDNNGSPEIWLNRSYAAWDINDDGVADQIVPAVWVPRQEPRVPSKERP